MAIVSCKYSDQQSNAEFGMEVRDGQEQIVYVLSDRVVRFGKFAKKLTVSRGFYIDTYCSDVVIDTSDFICVSSMGRGVMWFANNSQYAGLTILDGGAPVLQVFNQKQYLDRVYWQGSDGFFLGVPVCKCPIERDYN
jgi:hypothetical protein